MSTWWDVKPSFTLSGSNTLSAENIDRVCKRVTAHTQDGVCGLETGWCGQSQLDDITEEEANCQKYFIFFLLNENSQNVSLLVVLLPLKL